MFSPALLAMLGSRRGLVSLYLCHILSCKFLLSLFTAVLLAKLCSLLYSFLMPLLLSLPSGLSVFRATVLTLFILCFSLVEEFDSLHLFLLILVTF